jgi:hypothetical protein
MAHYTPVPQESVSTEIRQGQATMYGLDIRSQKAIGSCCSQLHGYLQPYPPARCLVYIDLNRVRAGVVDHPVNWKHSGYQEIQTPLSRYSIIDSVKLRALLEIGSDQMLIDTHRGWVECV